MQNQKTVNIRLVGVGGQGILLAGEVLCDVLLASGWDVKKSEVHGMSQRGGSVNSDIRFGTKVYSPLIPDGKVDFLVAFEQMEALRYSPGLGEGATLIVNVQKIQPSTVASGAAKYPDGILSLLASYTPNVLALDAEALAKQAGSIRSVNIVLLGALSRFLDIAPEVWDKALRDRLSGKGLEANLKAFRLGLKAVEKAAASSGR
jgi:indolepyruvate ferredoxin oxidoreductase beta subunit